MYVTPDPLVETPLETAITTGWLANVTAAWSNGDTGRAAANDVPTLPVITLEGWAGLPLPQPAAASATALVIVKTFSAFNDMGSYTREKRMK